MKYSVSIEINKPINKVIELFDNQENMKKWMEGLVEFETIKGPPGAVGSQARLKFIMGRREVEMIETITVRKLPDEFSATYEAKGVFNLVTNRFVSVGNNITKCINEQEFQFKGFMRLFATLMPGAFKKQSMKYLKSFKDFVESEG